MGNIMKKYENTNERLLIVFCYKKCYFKDSKEQYDFINASFSTTNDIDYGFLAVDEFMVIAKGVTIYCDYFMIKNGEEKIIINKESVKNENKNS